MDHPPSHTSGDRRLVYLKDRAWTSCCIHPPRPGTNARLRAYAWRIADAQNFPAKAQRNEQHQSHQHGARKTANRCRYSHLRPLRQHLRPKSPSAVAAPRDQYRLCKLHKAAGRLERRARKSCFQFHEEAKLPSSASRQHYCKNDGRRRKK